MAHEHFHGHIIKHQHDPYGEHEHNFDHTHDHDVKEITSDDHNGHSHDGLENAPFKHGEHHEPHVMALAIEEDNSDNDDDPVPSGKSRAIWYGE